MWRIQLLLSLACSLLIHCEANSDCRMPTEDDPVSICSYCSDSHAGVRWAVHPSTLEIYPYGAYHIDLKFTCSNLTTDSCFNGDLIPGLIFLAKPSVWRWHILEHRLLEGTECHFTAHIEDGFLRKLPKLNRSTSCTVHDNESVVILPATCSNSSEQQECSCQCAEGFKTDDEVYQFLTCLNINECSEGTHNCSNVNNCVDTEGSYYCTNGSETVIIPSAVITGTSNHSTTTLVTKNDETTTTPAALINDSSSGSTTLQTSNSKILRSLPPDTTHGAAMKTTYMYTTIHTFDYAPGPGLISAGVVAVIIAVSLVSMFVTIIIAMAIFRKKQRLSKDKKMIVSPQYCADPFDPDFCPVDIEKFDSHSLSAMSTKTVLDPLRWSTDIDVLSTSNSFGSVIILDFCD